MKWREEKNVRLGFEGVVQYNCNNGERDMRRRTEEGRLGPGWNIWVVLVKV